MPSRSERIAWEVFREVMKHRALEFDGAVPVVLITLPVVSHDGEGNIVVDQAGRIGQLWPPGGFTMEERAQLLERAAADIRKRCSADVTGAGG
jgi:hypothetical protein